MARSFDGMKFSSKNISSVVQRNYHRFFALPPSITASKVYRCADNAVVYVNWLSDGSATVRDKPDATPTVVAAGSAELKGGADAKSITYKGESCKA
jgi:hypothetical protein